MIIDALQSLAVPLSDLKPMPGNPRRGDVAAVKRSYERFGQRKPIVAKRDGTVIAGNHQLMAAQQLKWPEIAVVYVDDDDMTAKAFALADNRIGDLGTYDEQSLAEMLVSVSSDIDLLLSTGYSEGDVTDLLAGLTVNEAASIAQIDSGAAPPDASLTHDIDVFFNARPLFAKIATAMGWRAGTISRVVNASYLQDVSLLNLEINFVDNEFKEYDHEQHLSAVKALAPKYATVRDIMSRSQCEAAKIEFFSFDEVMDMARSVQEYAQNVIVVPKYDCINDIPADMMLGYSIPTSYGATPISIDRFRGRRVHLLGGSWKRQRNALGVLGKDVVSLDNNHLMNIGRFGQCYSPQGQAVRISEVLPGGYGNIIPMLVSMSAIIADLSRAGCSVNGRRFASKEDDVDTALTIAGIDLTNEFAEVGVRGEDD